MPRNSRILAVLFAFCVAAPFAQAADYGTYADGTPASSDEANYDRLDGTGASGKKVDVVDWQGNLEIHVYPKGSLKGLALKIDRKNKDRPVMVIGYRFNDNPKTQLIRRALLTMPMTDHFKTFQDPSEPDFDKIIISDNGLSGDLLAYKLEPAPKQLYPDGHPALSQGTGTATNRSPASKGPRATKQRAGRATASDDGESAARRQLEDSGTIHAFGTD